ncbi:MAG: hypothetical protein JWQ71_740 [Pedosphaera sp.]|nr:hypothetical protein [Pedosphaera sp.]
MKKPFKEFRIDWTDNVCSKNQSPSAKKPLREYRIKFEKVPKGKKAVPDPDKLGIRSKLGGEPDWVQSPEIPECSDCKQPMTFIAQIDSMEHDEKHNPHAIDCLSRQQQYMFGDVGMIYVFMCFSCMTTKSVVQCG